MGILKRSDENPILVPNRDHPWESDAVFNGSPVHKGSQIHFFYRAVSSSHYHADSGAQLKVSTIGHAQSRDGIHFRGRSQFIFPQYNWERYGCEDPRATKLNGKYYIFYTALSSYPLTPAGIHVGVAITKDLKHIESKHSVTPFNSKAMALFPEKIKGKMVAVLTANTDIPPAKIGIAFFNNEHEMLSPEYWNAWYASLDTHIVPLQRRVEDHIEVGAPPLKTKLGWLLMYSYIRNYFTPEKRIFSVEAALLDLKNPAKVIAHSEIPLMIPEEEYEIFGSVPNIVFPSGAFITRGVLHLYYGAADSTCGVATCALERVLHMLVFPKQKRVLFERHRGNPIIAPAKDHLWEERATFNPGSYFDGHKAHIIYRAMSLDNTSVFGYAQSKDGVHIQYRSPEPIYMPRADFEQKLNPGGNSGCEDPRLTKLGDRIYMLYTAYDGKNPPRVALTSISEDDFLRHQWRWKEPVLVSPPGMDDKDACLLPKKVRGKYVIFHRLGNSIDIAFVDDLDFPKPYWLEEHKWVRPRRGAWDGAKVGISAPPLETRYGWILLYHGVSEDDHGYRVGALLLDLRNPERILARTDYPLFEPREEYEKQGEIPNVVFPCGAEIIKNKIYLYYGGADKVVGVASLPLAELITILKKNTL